MSARPVWQSDGPRVDVTFSLRTRRAADAALAAVNRALATVGTGYTATSTVGGWRGDIEAGYTVSMIGMPHTARVVSALIDAGCEAIQVETFGLSSRCPYLVEEWRAQ